MTIRWNFFCAPALVIGEIAHRALEEFREDGQEHDEGEHHRALPAPHYEARHHEAEQALSASVTTTSAASANEACWPSHKARSH